MRFLLLCLFCFQCSTCLAAVPQIEVGASNNLPPDHPSILLMEKAYQQLGYQMKLVVMPLERSAYESNKGQLLDAELNSHRRSCCHATQYAQSKSAYWAYPYYRV